MRNNHGGGIEPGSLQGRPLAVAEPSVAEQDAELWQQIAKMNGREFRSFLATPENKTRFDEASKRKGAV